MENGKEEKKCQRKRKRRRRRRNGIGRGGEGKRVVSKSSTLCKNVFVTFHRFRKKITKKDKG